MFGIVTLPLGLLASDPQKWVNIFGNGQSSGQCRPEKDNFLVVSFQAHFRIEGGVGMRSSSEVVHCCCCSFLLYPMGVMPFWVPALFGRSRGSPVLYR